MLLKALPLNFNEHVTGFYTLSIVGHPVLLSFVASIPEGS